MLTEYKRGQVLEAIRTAIQRANGTTAQITQAKQSVLDARANYLLVKQICTAAGLTDQEILTEFGNDFAAEIGGIFALSSVQLIALLAEVSRITGVSARASLTALAAAAPDTIPTESQTVEINGSGQVVFVG